jgi:hypothetical protein
LWLPLTPASSSTSGTIYTGLLLHHCRRHTKVWFTQNHLLIDLNR